MDWPGTMALAVAAGLAAWTAWTDWRRREVPDWTVLTLVGLWGFAAVFAPGALGGTAMEGLACGAAGLAAGFVLHALGWLGGGDGKLLAAAALWLGPVDLGFGLLAAAALLLALWVGLRRRAADNRGDGIPFACALAPPTAVLLAARGVGLMG